MPYSSLRSWGPALAVALLLRGPPAQAQTPAAKPTPGVTAPAALRLDGLDGLDGKNRNLTAAALAALPRQEVRATGKDNQAHTYQGVALADVLALVGAPQGKAIHGKALALVAEAADGYHGVFALPELDDAFASQVVLLATARFGQPLLAKSGPYQIIVPQEKRPARRMRQVRCLHLVRVPAQLGHFFCKALSTRR
ncbi:molybdopterin-dependent oxidoreductase [Hymenobacter nivis]|uniref:Molybdopterin-binding protein n=1 Tax=Hymenobacter nivis TaxID=1850093 RepID=A0A2Z3GM69_9BACT|nr:molybdopterin-dependent oxidoreductase [Hymenobacter nivis]AWM34328.1 molybdopterin-binding protein [Hymenobacter nivis]